jgi:hypothetical protein
LVAAREAVGLLPEWNDIKDEVKPVKYKYVKNPKHKTCW